MKYIAPICLPIAIFCLFSDARPGAASSGIGSDPPLGERSQILNGLTGMWDVEYVDFSKDGKVTRHEGEFSAGWVMDGRAMRDLWIVYPYGARQVREVYADLRFFDAKSGTWSAIFVDPEHASSAKFTGGVESDSHIVFDTADLGHQHNRWSFQKTGSDTYVFRDEASDDDGKSWRLISEDRLKRRGTAGNEVMF